MQRNRFLPDILTTLFDRRRTTRNDNDSRDINQLCHALLAEEGRVSGEKLADIILTRYRGLDDTEKLDFFRFINAALDVDGSRVAELALAFAQTRTTDDFERLSEAATSSRRKLLGRLNQPTGATFDLVSMRVDLLRLMKSHPELGRTDFDFTRLLRTWFNLGFLVLKQIDWNAPASLLDKIVAYEAVHQIDDLDDLRRRLSPSDRRCFAFFHPAMPDEPLIFVEVALSDHIPGSIDDVLIDGREPLQPERASAAVFYSISNCQQGLKGISFGNLLIKQVVRQLSVELPRLTHFVTLSPIPRLNTWLSGQLDDEDIGQVAGSVLDGTANPDEVRAIAARYLLDAKQETGAPLDPVARFHLGNGAEIFDVHAGADNSDNGRSQSSGVMVNYLYDLAEVERNHEGYTHEDAEVIAATVSGMPDSLGGKRMAIRVAELARAGLTPDWMPGALPRCIPVEMKRNRHGDHATTVVVGTERVLSRGKWRTVEVRACPVTYRPYPEQIEAARRDYQARRQALGWVRDGLQSGGMLREVEVVEGMPRARPWAKPKSR